jgi:ubiquinone/menaquinone biosynthesis C-methylase UbiE
MTLPRVERDIPGNYQLDAMLRGWPLQRAWHRARLDLVSQVLPPEGDRSSLDLAAGAGLLTWRFPESAPISIDMRLEACRAVRAHTPRAHAIVAGLERLPFRPATFSRLYFLETIEHLTADEGRRVLEEVRRVARHDARCLVTTPNYRSHWILLEWLIDALHLTPPMIEGQHVSRYDSASLRRMLEGSGWRVLQLGSFNLLAPFAGVLSGTLGRRALGFETRRAGHAGALLFAVCEPRR